MYMWSHYPTQIRNKFNINHWAVTTPTFTTLKKWEWPGDEAGVDIVAAAGNCDCNLLATIIIQY